MYVFGLVGTFFDLIVLCLTSIGDFADSSCGYPLGFQFRDCVCVPVSLLGLSAVDDLSKPNTIDDALSPLLLDFEDYYYSHVGNPIDFISVDHRGAGDLPGGCKGRNGTNCNEKVGDSRLLVANFYRSGQNGHFWLF